MHHFKEVSALFSDYLQAHDPFPQAPDDLYAPCRYLLYAGGKRVRPALCLMANEMFGDIRADAYHVAMAVELFHNFTLIHDDIMDKAPLRRGMPTVHIRYGTTAAILSGDVMNIFAYRCLDHVSSAYLPVVLQLFNRTAIEVCEGQQWDMNYEKKDQVTIDEYLKMIELKTAVLLACSLQTGALLADAPIEDQLHLYEFGRCLGLAFQLQDDYLDTFGAASAIGKQPGGDILANKKTALLIKCQEIANDNESDLLRRHLTGNAPDKVEVITNMYLKNGVDSFCKELINQYSMQSYDHLEKVQVPAVQKQALKDLAGYLLDRNH